MSRNLQPADKRLFPRMEVRCPVLYRLHGSVRDVIGLAVDFSATGLKMLCKEAAPVGAGIHVELKPGRQRAIPALVADGHVVRCEPYPRGGYWVSCHLTRIQRRGDP